MSEIYMLQPMTEACELFAGSGRQRLACELDLAALLRDPMTQALMAADRVDRGELDSLLAGARENLRSPA
jgi:hypothetical protein